MSEPIVSAAAYTAVLGPLVATVDGVAVAIVGLTQRRLLALAALAAPNALSAQDLVESMGVSIAGVRTAVSRLRKLVGPGVLVSVGGGYQYVGGCDAADFEEAFQEATSGWTDDEVLPRLRESLALWRGTALVDFDSEPWATVARTRLVELRDGRLELLAEGLIGKGRFDEAAAEMRGLLGEQPYRDNACGLLMRALAAQGRQTEALRAFQAHRQRLVDEVGVEPGTELRSLEARLAGGWHDALDSEVNRFERPSAADQPGTNLIRPRTSLVGRDDEVAGVLSAIETNRETTLLGVGGVGKTRLATEVGLTVEPPVDGVWIVDLGTVAVDADVPGVIAQTLRIQTAPDKTEADSVVTWCSGRSALLIIDNCEHVVRGAASIVDTMLSRAPGITVLATSREPLMISGESIYPVQPLPLAGLAEQAVAPASQLFIDRATTEYPAFDPPSNLTSIDEICARLDGIPLAIELAAARIRALDVAEIATRLDERFRLLTGGRRTAVERHATLRATLQWSYDLLTAEQRELFDRLSVFWGPFDLGDVIAMRPDGLDEVDVVNVLSDLINRSLVVRTEQVPQYRMLETLRAYGRDQVASSGRSQALRLLHARHMRAKAADHRVHAAGPDEAEVVALLGAQLADFAGAVRSAVDAGQPELAAHITQDAHASVCLYSPRAQTHWLKELAESDCSERWMGVVKWTSSVRATFFDGDTELGLRYGLEAAEIDPTNSLVHMYGSMAALLHGDLHRALTSATIALETAADVAEEACARMMLGNSLLVGGDVRSAGKVAAEFVDFAEQRGFPSAIGMAYHLLGRTIADEEPERALQAWTKGLEAAAGVDQWIVEVSCLREMMGVLIDVDIDRTRGLAVRVLGLCRRHNEAGNAAVALKYSATILANTGDARLAARVASRVGNSALSPLEEKRFAETVSRLHEALGDEYDSLASRATSEDLNGLIVEVMSVLE